MSADPRYPLGVPVNRQPSTGLRPIEGRPNWFRDAHDIERYIEPERVQPGVPAGQTHTEPSAP